LQVNGGGGMGGGGGPRGSAVRAEALAPSGRRLPVDVVEKPDGTYSANFTPTESGTYSSLVRRFVSTAFDLQKDSSYA